MILFDRLAPTHRQGAESADTGLGEELPQRIGQFPLVTLDRQQIIPALIDDLLRDLGLAADGINGARPRRSEAGTTAVRQSRKSLAKKGTAASASRAG
jgi:hypothetical protein